MKYIEIIYKRRNKKIKDFMLKNGISSFAELVRNTEIHSSSLSSSIKNELVSDKYARTIEEKYNLPILYFDLEESIVYNKGYTLESYKDKKSLFKICNSGVSEDCFYIEIIDDDFYKMGALVLFKPVNNIEKLDANKNYLVKYKNKYLIAKSRVLYLITFNKEDITLDMAEIIAEEIRVEF